MLHKKKKPNQTNIKMARLAPSHFQALNYKLCLVLPFFGSNLMQILGSQATCTYNNAKATDSYHSAKLLPPRKSM